MPGPSRRFVPQLPSDPDLAIVRRAARAAIVIPAALAFAVEVIRDVQVAPFVAFGCFALLVMADFGGPRRARALAYVTVTLAGAALVALGTLASSTVWVGALLMLLVGFGIQFLGVFGGYAAAAQTALLLSFVLAVSIPAPADQIGSRLLGWFIAGAVSTVAGVFLWPRFERIDLRAGAARACRALGRLADIQHQSSDQDKVAQAEATARSAVGAVQRQYGATLKRPAEPARRDRAFAELLVELERLLDFATRRFRLQPSPTHPRLAEGDRLAAAIVGTLEGSAGMLTGGAAPDLVALDRARLAHRLALDRWAEEALQTKSPEEVLAGLDADHGLRVISYLVLAIGANATITAGGHIAEGVRLPAGTPLEGRTRPAIRIARTVRTHLSPTSSVLHQSLRVGIALGLAVLLARLLLLQHAFWVVLGTLSVLRSNALGTGRTTAEALTGTIIGFAAGALFTLLVGGNSVILWAVLPIVVFLATYAAGAVGFVVGQAAFTVLVIILFNLLSPAGWRVGLVRVEDVALGVGISVFAGLLLWPRGARGELAVALAGLYRAIASYLAGSFGHILEHGTPESVSAGRRQAVRARDRADTAFDLFLHERGTRTLDPQTAAFLLASGSHALIIGDLLNLVAEMGYQVQDTDSTDVTLRAQTQLVLAGFLRLADRLDDTTSALISRATVSDAALHDAALLSLQRWREAPGEGREALAVVIAGEWLQQLGELVADLDAPVTTAVEAARRPWWR